MKIKLTNCLIFCLLVINLLVSPLAIAQSANSSGFAAAISPLPILLNINPGESVSTDIRVNNPSSSNERLKVVLKTFTQDGLAGNVTLHDPTPADSFINWISFDRTEFDAPAGLWQTVKMTVSVPKTAAFGYYFAVEFTSANPTPKTANGTAIQGAVASFVLLNAKAPGEKRQMQVTSFTADHRFYEFLPATFKIRLHNSGNVYAGASGNIFIMRGSKQIAVLNVNENHGLVLPNSNREFSVSWDNGFPVYKTINDSSGRPVLNKAGQPKRHLSWNLSQIPKLRFGHYTAKLALVYNDGNRDVPISGELSFWVIPWRIIIVLLIFLIGLPLIAVLYTRSRRRVKQLEKELSKHQKASDG